MPQVREFCKTGMWIEGGELVEMGDIDKVCDDYAEYVEFMDAMTRNKRRNSWKKSLKNV